MTPEELERKVVRVGGKNWEWRRFGRLRGDWSLEVVRWGRFAVLLDVRTMSGGGMRVVVGAQNRIGC